MHAHQRPTPSQPPRQAFCDADTFLLLNTPPRWDASRGGGFAAARPGVLWHCHSVEATHQPRGVSGAADGSRRSDSSGGGSSGGASWQTTERDVWGRSLPSQGLGGAAAGAGRLAPGAFVAQDNAAAVADRLAALAGGGGGGGGGTGGGAGAAQDDAPPGASFVIRRGALLSDAATGGDVEALLGGRATVVTLQAWPGGHPLALRDGMLLHALAEAPGEGLPAWLAAGGGG
jgi:hypothetical protein